MPYKNIEDRRACSRRMIQKGYYKKYYQEHKEKYRQSEIRGKEKRKIRAKKYVNIKYQNNIKFRKKILARNLAKANISIKDKVCNICNSKEKLHRHHEDYDKPLEVIILCKKCHENIHNQLSYPRGNNWGLLVSVLIHLLPLKR